MNELNQKVTVGTIFHCSWGYDQTQADFYQVVSMTPKGVYVRRIDTVPVSGSEGFMCQNVMPVKDRFLPISNYPIKFRRLSVSEKYTSFRISKYQTAFLWDGKPQYNSWYA